MALFSGTVAEPFIVSTYRPIDEEDTESRETTVFGEENAHRVFKRKVSSEAYWCVRLDRARYNEHNGTIDYIGKDGKLEYWVSQSAPRWMNGNSLTDIPWWVDNGEEEDYALSDERYYALSGDPWDV